jgi:hypothetical protein
MPIRKKAKSKPSFRTKYFNNVNAKEADKPDSQGFPKEEARARFCASGQVGSGHRAKAYVYDHDGVLVYMAVMTANGMKANLGRAAESNVVPLRKKA